VVFAKEIIAKIICMIAVERDFSWLLELPLEKGRKTLSPFKISFEN
jgi:hypothetical protein